MLREAERDSYVRSDAALVRELEYLCTHDSSYFVPTTITSFHFVFSCRKSRCSLAKTESGIIESKDSFGETKDGALPDYSSSISTLPPNISF